MDPHDPAALPPLPAFMPTRLQRRIIDAATDIIGDTADSPEFLPRFCVRLVFLVQRQTLGAFSVVAEHPTSRLKRASSTSGGNWSLPRSLTGQSLALSCFIYAVKLFARSHPKSR